MSKIAPSRPMTLVVIRSNETRGGLSP